MSRPDVEVVILAGGSGTRLWPASNDQRPKQFLRLPGEKTLLEQAITRAVALAGQNHVWIITLASQVNQLLKEIPTFDSQRILGEPMGKNSAAAILSAAFWIEATRGKPTTLLILTADHWIPEEKKFVRQTRAGIARASEGKVLVTFGVRANEPNTEYGYIEVGPKKRWSALRPAKRFVEKPSLTLAKKYVRSKNYFWNSGMFAWRTDFLKREMSKHAPEIFAPLSGMEWTSPYRLDQLARAYSLIPNISIDYALMEKSDAIEVVPVDFTWSDLGNWASVFEILPKQKGNAICGGGTVIEGENNMVYAGGKPIFLFGVENLVVVEGEEAVMVTTREKAKDLKRFLQLSKQARSSH